MDFLILEIKDHLERILAKRINLLSEYDDESQYDFLSHQCEYELSNKSPKANKQCNKITDYLVQI